MTKDEKAIVAAYTSYLVGEFSDMHKYIETKMGRPVMSHEMAYPPFVDELREKVKSDFVGLSTKKESKVEQLEKELKDLKDGIRNLKTYMPNGGDKMIDGNYKACEDIFDDWVNVYDLEKLLKGDK